MSKPVKRPALRYYGGKWKIAPWIISYFPPHLNYVEPCGGGASVLLQKQPSRLETYNDLDGDVVNFFRVLRDDKEALLEKIHLTPWARDEYDYCLQPADEPIERARRFYCISFMSFNGALTRSKSTYGWRSTTDYRSRSPAVYDIQSNDLWSIAERMASVQIENKDWREVVDRYDNDQTLIYIDPPYIESERAKRNRYTHEWTDRDHIAAAAVLSMCKGFVIVSGYDSPLYSSLYSGWTKVDRLTVTNSGAKRSESLWLSPRTVEALHGDLPLFRGNNAR